MSGRGAMTWQVAEKYLKKAVKAGDEKEIAYWTNMRDRFKAMTWSVSADLTTMTNDATGEVRPYP